MVERLSRNEQEMSMKKNQLVKVYERVPGYPLGLLPNTFCRIKQIKKDKILLVADDGRQGEWWVEKHNVKDLWK